LERARLLAALMRIAYPVSVAMEGVLPQAPLRARGNQVVLQLPGHMEPLANERLTGRLRALGKLLNMEPVIEIL
jgi:exopolyphosphatase/guanosine-5'-triphosphate,3'-diphosphate pyrophosphatase